jgi:hypothetical protein
MAIIKRRRSMTRKDRITVTSESTGAALDITGCSFVMHVTTDKAPDALGTNLLYSVAGVIEDAAGGVVTFSPTELQATQPDGTYYYEIVMIDAGGLTDSVALDKMVFF